MTMPLPTPDLATDPDLRWRAGKIIAEKLARKLGVELAETGPFQAIGRELKGFLGTGTAAHWLTSAGGIFAATGLQSPRVLANSLAGFTGFDADKLHDLLNEAFDSTILSTVSAMERAGRSQAEIEAKVDEHLKRLKDDDKFDFKDEIRVVVFGGGIHDRECTTVLDRERTQRRRRNNQDDDDDDDRPRLRPDAREMTLAKAIDLGYSTIARPRCCGPAIEKLLDKQMKKPMDLPACIESLKDSKEDAEKALRIAYYALLAGASDRQRGAIRDLGERKVWTPSEAVVYLQQANGNLDVFIRLLESRVKLPGKSPLEQGADWVKKNWKALLGMKPADAPSQAQPAPAAGAAAQPPVPADNAATEVDAVRGAVNGFSRNIRRDAARRTRRADRLEAEFNRKR